MRTILFIIQKEFRQIFRNKTMIPMIFFLPFVQLIILVNAATMDMRNINMIIVDNDMSSSSRKLGEKFSQSPFFTLVKQCFSSREAEDEMLVNATDMILIIPDGFEQQLYKQEGSPLQVQVDAINGMTAGLISSYASQIINVFNLEFLATSGRNALVNLNPKSIMIDYSYWYNSELEFKYYMVPGILAILLTIIGMFLASLNLVREKEIGTIEQINVTPIRKVQFIIGKLVPFWIIAMFELALGLGLGKLLFDIPIEGNLLLLFAYATLYLVAVLSIGLFISTLSQTQQQAQFLNFFVLVTFVMMSGIFTPTESMPHWAQELNRINPMAYFIKVNRMILLKGSGFSDIAGEFATMAIMAVTLNALAIWRYRKIA
jgi:ABC-2 type transport system permease protein